MISAPHKTRMRADPWRHQVPSASRQTLMATAEQCLGRPYPSQRNHLLLLLGPAAQNWKICAYSLQ